MAQLNISIRNSRNLTDCFAFIFHLIIQNWVLRCSIPCYKYLLFTKDIFMLNLIPGVCQDFHSFYDL